MIKAILHGLTGPIDGRAYPQVMPASGANRDEWVADVASFIRNGFGNAAGFVIARLTSPGFARRRATGRRRGREESIATLPRPLIPDTTWKVTASHNADTARGALDYTRWTSGAPQQSGMWVLVEMPKPAMLTEIQFDSPPAAGARGGPPPAGTFPRAYRVEVSTDGASWSQVAEGQGTGRITAISFAPIRATAVRITQTATTENAPMWFIERLRLYEAPATPAGGPR